MLAKQLTATTMKTTTALKGVDHLAYVTWKPEETVHFYRDVLQLPLVHAITATGWVSESFPDFVHFFFALGKGNHLAFFYYFGLPQTSEVDDLMHRSYHLALHVDTEEELHAWRVRLKDQGIRVTHPLGHELLESIYFDDPNGIQLEIARPLRPFNKVDGRDADLTIQALAQVARAEHPTVEEMWRRKAQLVREHTEASI